MSTPYDGKLNWWYWRPDSVAPGTRTALAAEVRKRTPKAAGVIVKVAHGHTWQGPVADKGALAIHGPDDVARWAGSLTNYGLDCHIWATPVGADPQREAMVVAQAANAPGVKSVILDVEPYDGFWQGDAAAATQYMWTLRASVPDSLHIGISVDSRTDEKLAAIHFGTWLGGGIGSVHPQVYWHDFGLKPHDAYPECIGSLEAAGIDLDIVFPALGTYPNPRTGLPVPPDELHLAMVVAGCGYDGASLFRLGGDNWTPDICDAINKGWGNV